MTPAEIFLLIFAVVGHGFAIWFGHRNVHLAGENARLRSAQKQTVAFPKADVLTPEHQAVLDELKAEGVLFIPPRKSEYRTDELGHKGAILKELAYKGLVYFDFAYPSVSPYGEFCMVYMTRDPVTGKISGQMKQYADVFDDDTITINAR